MKIIDLLYFAGKICRLHLQPSFRIPLSIYIILTNRCNNNCVYCDSCDLPQKDVFTTKSLKNILAEMKKCGTKRIHLSGGEPMLRSDLGEIISYAKELGFFVGLSTNGYQVAERIKDLKGLDVVFLSYDGPDEIHSRLRGKKNVKEVKTALSALKLAGIRVWTTTVLTAWNTDYLEDIVDFARKNRILANFNRLEFILKPPCYLHPLIENVQHLLLTGKQRKMIFKKLINLKLSGAPIGSSLAYLKNGLEWSCDDQITSSELSQKYKCWAGIAWGHLNFNGKLYSCGWEILRGKPGVDVFKSGFALAWEKLKPVDGCRSCSHACGVENNLIFSLNPASIFNALTHLFKK